MKNIATFTLNSIQSGQSKSIHRILDNLLWRIYDVINTKQSWMTTWESLLIHSIQLKISNWPQLNHAARTEFTEPQDDSN